MALQFADTEDASSALSSLANTSSLGCQSKLDPGPSKTESIIQATPIFNIAPIPSISAPTPLDTSANLNIEGSGDVKPEEVACEKPGMFTGDNLKPTHLVALDKNLSPAMKARHAGQSVGAGINEEQEKRRVFKRNITRKG